MSYDDKADDILYEVINRRYERKSIIVTTNRVFKEWNEVFPNATCIAAMLDRLLHHADVTVIEGESYRVRESEQGRRRTEEKMKQALPDVANPNTFTKSSLSIGSCRNSLASQPPRSTRQAAELHLRGIPLELIDESLCWVPCEGCCDHQGHSPYRRFAPSPTSNR